MLSRPFQQHMCPIYIRVRELVRVAEAEIDMRLSSEVKYSIDIVLAEHALHIGRRRNVSLFEAVVRAVVENTRVV